MMSNVKQCFLKVLLFKDDSIEDLWISHCLDVDLVSQGSSLEESLDSLREAVLMIFSDDLENNIDPLKRESAPQECWDKFGHVMQVGQPFRPEESSHVSSAVFMFEITRPPHPVVDGYKTAVAPYDVAVPEAWQLAAYDNMRNSEPCAAH
jgi:hypothetical protein